MRGVSGNASVSLQALKAGNDMVLAPRNLKTEVAAVIEAVDRGELSREDIDRKCRKVLTYKYVLGLKRKPAIQLSGLGSRINTPQTRDLIRRLNLAAITVLNNKGNILPLHSDKEMPPMAMLEVGDVGETDIFAKQLEKHTSLVRFRLRKEMTEAQGKALRDSLSKYRPCYCGCCRTAVGTFSTFFCCLGS